MSMSIRIKEISVTALMFSNFLGGITQRDCLRSNNNLTTVICDQKIDCFSCSTDKCNNHSKSRISFNPLSLEAKDESVPISTHSDEFNVGNVQQTKRQCIVCDSNDDPKCIARTENSMRQQCPDSEQDLGCFHMINGNNHPLDSILNSQYSV